MSNRKFMRLDKTEHFYFHTTQGKRITKKTVVLKPRGIGDNRIEEEPLVYRICVSREIAGCLSAVSYNIADIRVYATLQKAWSPFGVEDSRVTGEKWILEDTEFYKVFTIPAKFTELIRSCDGYAEQKDVNHNKKVLRQLYEDGNIEIHDWECDLLGIDPDKIFKVRNSGLGKKRLVTT